MTQIGPDPLRRSGAVIVIGCFPPRQCGIATFTQDTVRSLQGADPDLTVSVVAIAEGDETLQASDPVALRIRRNDPASYADAARFINDQRASCVIIQHEFGIFGGPAGDFLLNLLPIVKAPVVTIFHTMIEEPDSNQFRVMRRLVHRSARLVVMAERGADMLRDIYGARPDKIAVIPHGAPVRPYAEPAAVRERLGILSDPMISTFGLLSPNKGIESVIQAMPELLEQFPLARYVVLGVTHPKLVAREGEAYRNALEGLAQSLGVSGSVQFINRFVDSPELFDYLQASDVYITPYLNEAQITSGTLSYALALGCYVVSTRYWHAQEALTRCPGTLVPRSDSSAISRALIEQFQDPDGLAARRREVYQWADPTRWPAFGARLLRLIDSSRSPGQRVSHISEQRGPVLPAIALKSIERMTDDCGIFQHSRYTVPDRTHGYCVDDNARALILCNEVIRRGMFSSGTERLHAIYAAFVLNAFEPGSGQFRNFMAYNREWVTGEPSQDSQGRAFWALGHAAATSQYAGNSGWALKLLKQAIGQAQEITSPRARALIILGCAELMQSDHGCDCYADLMRRFAGDLGDQLDTNRSEGWDWLEDSLSYDNGRVPQAMLVAARLGGNYALARSALSSLAWLCDIQFVDHGLFAPVGSESFGRLSKPPLPHDQQPIEAAAMLDACFEAYKVTGEVIWWRRARTVFSWFYGRNSHDLSLVDPVTGHCHDGLNRSGLNLNAGAESLLAFQMAVCTYQAFLERVDAVAPQEQGAHLRQAAGI